MYTRLLEPDQISYTQSMVAKREAAQIGQTFVSLYEKSLKKHSAAEFQSIQHIWL